LIRQRLEFVIRTIEVDVVSRKLQAMTRGSSSGELAELAVSSPRSAPRWKRLAQVVEQRERADVLAAGDFKRIEELGRQSYAA